MALFSGTEMGHHTTLSEEVIVYETPSRKAPSSQIPRLRDEQRPLKHSETVAWW